MATSMGGHLHQAARHPSDGESGAGSLTTLPAEPREAVMVLFPCLPSAYLTDAAVARIMQLVSESHASCGNTELRACAVDALKELEAVHTALTTALDGEGFLWRGASVKGRDILRDLSVGRGGGKGGAAPPQPDAAGAPPQQQPQQPAGGLQEQAGRHCLNG